MRICLVLREAMGCITILIDVSGKPEDHKRNRLGGFSVHQYRCSGLLQVAIRSVVETETAISIPTSQHWKHQQTPQQTAISRPAAEGRRDKRATAMVLRVRHPWFAGSVCAIICWVDSSAEDCGSCNSS